MAHTEPPPGPPPSSKGPFQGEMRFGPYVLERRIAVGGSAEVYVARPFHGELPAKKLVVKRLLPALREDPSATDMFAKEAAVHRLVSHPNVVRIYEIGVALGEPYLAMEYIEGVDAARLLRRAHAEGRPIPPGVAAYIAHSIGDALSAVHGAKDENGEPLKIIHRDVTPSNIYLSTEGDVRLGDFGIARAATRRSLTRTAELKGKYGYLSPEQVNGDPYDHRADLFALAVVTAELVIGGPVFPGDGHLAVLLAVRDGRLDNLRDAAGKMPPALLAILERALDRDPEARFQSAAELVRALAPFEAPGRDSWRYALREWVTWGRDTASIARHLEASMHHADRVPRSRPGGETPVVPARYPSEEVTQDIDIKLSRIRLPNGDVVGVTFARLIEMIVTGSLAGTDEVDLMGQGFRRVLEIDVLERHLPDEVTTRTVQSPGPPDATIDLTTDTLLDLFARIYGAKDTGLVLFESTDDGGKSTRKEAYVQNGLVIHVSSADASELLGQSLVRRKVVTPSELDMALAMLPRFEGRLGDTLIALGLIDAVQLFQAIQAQGEERLTRLFAGSAGRASFYRDVSPAKVEFPLELDLPRVMLGGLDVACADSTMMERSRAKLDLFVRRDPRLASVPRAQLPKRIAVLTDAVGGGMSLRHLLMRISTTGLVPTPDALRAVEVASALGWISLSSS